MKRIDTPKQFKIGDLPLYERIRIHIETTEECIENFNIPDYVKELLKQDNELLTEAMNELKQSNP